MTLMLKMNVYLQNFSNRVIVIINLESLFPRSIADTMVGLKIKCLIKIYFTSRPIVTKYGDFVLKFKKIMCRADFSKVIILHKRIGYSSNVMQKSACLVMTSITVDNRTL